MEFWLNGISEGSLVPSVMFASEAAAELALQFTLEKAKRAGCRVSQDEIAGYLIWTIRKRDGSIFASYWLASEEHGPAMRSALRR
jgi:hypothetical protein